MWLGLLFKFPSQARPEQSLLTVEGLSSEGGTG